jgi:hypothetical protein
MRKLGPYDRLAGAVREAIELDLKFDKILNALVCGCYFRANDEDGHIIKGDLEFIKICDKGIRSVLTTVCGFNQSEYADMFREAELLDKMIRKDHSIT